MEVNYIPRVVFELHYDFMLNFSEVYRGLLGPFVRLASNISLLNEGKITEALRLEFLEDKLRIDVCPDRMILLTEGEMPLAAFESSTSPGKVFFEILDKLRKVETFGNFRFHQLLMEYLFKLEGDKSTVIKRLQEAYIKPGILSLSGDPNLCVTRFGFKHDDIEQNMYIDYFDASLIENNSKDLFPFSRAKILEIIGENTKGMLSSYTRLESSIAKIDIKMIRQFTKTGFENFNNVISNGKLQ